MSDIPYIRPDEYCPNGMTPLYDAIGRGIGILDEASSDASQAKCVLIAVRRCMVKPSQAQ